MLIAYMDNTRPLLNNFERGGGMRLKPRDQAAVEKHIAEMEAEIKRLRELLAAQPQENSRLRTRHPQPAK